MGVSESLEKNLARLGLDTGSAKVLSLLPLVHVAWADGAVQDAERALILEQAQKLSLSPDATLVLGNWLAFAPSSDYVRRGHEALVALCGEAGAPVPLDDVVALCGAVAKAAGGLFGVGATSRSEAEAIARIAGALKVEVGRPWSGSEARTVMPESEAPKGPPKRVTVTFHTRELAGVRSPAVLVGETGERCPVDRKGIVVGRSRETDVQVSYDGLVSRKHCRLQERDRKYYVTDLGSTTGTWVDGERTLERRLLGGEELRVGTCRFRFEAAAIPGS